MKNLTKKIRDHDMFGHPVSLNFMSEGDVHKTAIGGFVSVWVKLAFLVYVAIWFKTMIYREGDSIMNDMTPLEMEEDEYVAMNETGMTMFYQITKQTSYSKALEINSETDRFIWFDYLWTHFDVVNQYFEPRWFRARQCTENDFAGYEKEWKAYQGYSLLCLDLENDYSFPMRGDRASTD